MLRPFDCRFCYYSSKRPLWNEPRPILATVATANQFIITRPARVANPEGVPFYFTGCLGDNDALRGHAYYIPLINREMSEALSRPNVSTTALKYLKGHIGMSQEELPSFWFHVLAVGFSSKYLIENADGLRNNWPRIPLPNKAAQLAQSVTLGQRVATLLDTETEVPGVTAGNIPEHFRMMGLISATDLKITAGWGHRDSKGRVSGGSGRTKIRSWTAEEQASLHAGFAIGGSDEARSMALLGRAVDVYLNESTFWRGVPESVWNFVIGGYQVVKKWLSYREEAVLGRALSKEEAREVTSIVRKLAAIVLMSDELDRNYSATCEHAYRWRADREGPADNHESGLALPQ